MKPSVASIKEKMGMTIKSNDDLVLSSANKPIDFILMPQAFADAIKLPGIPKGELSLIYGWSNTGKSTLINCAIAAAQRQGILPVIFDTESHFDFKYAIDCGMQATPKMGTVEVEDVDEETGEVIGTHQEERVIEYEGDFIYMDGDILCQLYGDNDYAKGAKAKKKRSIPVIEDVAYAINKILDMQAEGEIQQDIIFLWDSIGSLTSFRSYTSSVSNNMWDAGATQQAFNMIINNRIPLSKKVSSPYTNTMLCVNKIWLDNSSGGAMAAPSVELKSGKSMYFGAHGLIIQLGGVLKASTRRLMAISKGRNYQWGTLTKIRVVKNQLPTPFNITYEGTFICVHNGIISEEKADAYKKEYVPKLLKEYTNTVSGEMDSNEQIDEASIEYGEEEMNDE